MSKRQSKISCDISEEAKGMLSGYCLKHERSQGWLIEKMIRQFCVDTKQPAGKVPYRTTKEEMTKPKVKRFVPPTVEEVKEYCDSRCNNVNAQNFVDHYTGNGWVRGKTKVKCWKACVRTWEHKDKSKQQGTKQFSDITNQNIHTRGEWLDE